MTMGFWDMTDTLLAKRTFSMDSLNNYGHLRKSPLMSDVP